LWDALVPWFGAGGGASLVGLLAWLAYKMHMDAVTAHRQRAEAAERRAEDWRTAWSAERDRADVREDQISLLVSRVTKEHG